jgi:hypothetical protein
MVPIEQEGHSAAKCCIWSVRDQALLKSENIGEA